MLSRPRPRITGHRSCGGFVWRNRRTWTPVDTPGRCWTFLDILGHGWSWRATLAGHAWVRYCRRDTFVLLPHRSRTRRVARGLSRRIPSLGGVALWMRREDNDGGWRRENVIE